MAELNDALCSFAVTRNLNRLEIEPIIYVYKENILFRILKIPSFYFMSKVPISLQKAKWIVNVMKTSLNEEQSALTLNPLCLIVIWEIKRKPRN